MKEVTDFELGYLAGIIEGEGCFYVAGWENPSGNLGLDVLLSVSNEAPQLMRWLKMAFGGKIEKHNETGTFVWNLRKDEAIPLLQKLEGKLLFKEQQRNSFLRILESLGRPHKGIALSEQENEERFSLFKEHKKLIRLFRECKKGGRDKKSVVMGLSGGLDSTTLLYYLKWLGYKVITVSFDYGQRHSKELDRAKVIADLAGVENIVVDLSCLKGQISGSALTDSEITLPEEHYTHESQKKTVVPGRNMIFLSIAGSLAMSRGVDHIAFGAHSSDYAIYPDCRPPFVAWFEEAIKKGNYEDITVLAPFLSFSKTDIVFLANILKVPINETWSCYAGGDIHCGRCGTCRERIEAFDLSGVPDLTEYESRIIVGKEQ